MAKEFQCEHCHEIITVKFLSPSESTKCGSCGQIMIVPEQTDGVNETIGTVGETEEISNPFLSIWSYPRETIRFVLERDLLLQAHLFAGAWGVSQSLHLLFRHGIEPTSGTPLWSILGTNIVLGAVYGEASILVFSWLMSKFSKLFGGGGTSRAGQIAIGWSSLPHLFGLVLIPLMLFFPETFLYFDGSPLSENPALKYRMLYQLGHFVVGIWVIVISVTAISETFRLSIARSLGCILLAGLAYLLILVALGFLSNTFSLW